MKRIGSIIVMISAIFNLALGTVGLLFLFNFIKSTSLPWVDKIITNELLEKTKQIPFKSIKITYIILTAISFIQLFLAIGAWKKPRGFSAFFIAIIIIIQIGFSVFNGIKSNYFVISNIVRLSILGIAAIGITYGFIKGNF